MPHVIRREQLYPALKGIDQPNLAGSADEWRRRVDLDHGQSPAGGCDRVTRAGVRLLAHQQRVQFGLPGGRSTAAGRRGALVAAAGEPRCVETSFIALSFCRYNNSSLLSVWIGMPSSL